ncbi:hypothetical protein B0T21DRAFT_56089 [Apiosordaria backusii]|uniref:Uncharacterized protein n=1 Tax=Apiosordaria backusii TaxID=314023 RepID=A0AA40AMV9_9PEZI|nr:hypothetical protein B0T21DRAFT_56089 [Apiosordaria backusii]
MPGLAWGGEKEAVDQAGVEGYLTTALSKDMRRRERHGVAPSVGQWHMLLTPTFPMSACREGWRCWPGRHSRPIKGPRTDGEGLMRGSNVSIKPNAPVQHSSPSRAWACVAVRPVSPDALQGAIQPHPRRPHRSQTVEAMFPVQFRCRELGSGAFGSGALPSFDQDARKRIRRRDLNRGCPPTNGQDPDSRGFQAHKKPKRNSGARLARQAELQSGRTRSNKPAEGQESEVNDQSRIQVVDQHVPRMTNPWLKSNGECGSGGSVYIHKAIIQAQISLDG